MFFSIVESGTVITVLLINTAFTHGTIRSTVHTSLYYQHEFNTVLINNTVMTVPDSTILKNMIYRFVRIVYVLEWT